MNKKIVLFTSHRTNLGGGEVSFFELINSLKNDVDVLGAFGSKDWLFNKLQENYITDYVYMPSVKNIFSFGYGSLKIFFNYKKKNIDIIHCNSIRSYFYFFLLSYIKKIKTIIHIRVITKLNFFDCLALKMCGGIIAISEKVKENLVKYGIEKNKITVIYNGIDFGRINNIRETTNEFLRIGMLSRIEKNKGVDDFIKIILILNKKLKIKAYISGSRSAGEKRINIENLVVKEAAYENVKDFFENIDIYISTSYSEGFGRSILEALYAGKVVLTYDVGAIKEVTAGINGNIYFFEKGNHLAIADFILKNYDKTRKDNLEKIKKYIENKYNWNNIKQEFIKIYRAG